MATPPYCSLVVCACHTQIRNIYTRSACRVVRESEANENHAITVINTVNKKFN